MKKFNKYGAQHQENARVFNTLVGPKQATPQQLRNAKELYEKYVKNMGF